MSDSLPFRRAGQLWIWERDDCDSTMVILIERSTLDRHHIISDDDSELWDAWSSKRGCVSEACCVFYKHYDIAISHWILLGDCP